VIMVIYCFDFVSLLLRGMDATFSLCACSTTAGVADCFKKTIQWEGLGGLYKASVLTFRYIALLLHKKSAADQKQ
jgi:hypothetical protein